MLRPVLRGFHLALRLGHPSTIGPSIRPGGRPTLFAVSLAWIAAAGVPAASALTLDEARLVYREDFSGESTFPTTPESNTIAAPGLTAVTTGPSGSTVMLSGSAATVATSITGIGGETFDSAAGSVMLDFSASSVGAHSLGLRGRFEDLNAIPALPDIDVRPSANVALGWNVLPGDLPPFAVAGVVPWDDGFGQRFYLLTRNADLSTANAFVGLPADQTAQIRAGAPFTIDLIVDHEALLVKASLHQADWPSRSLEVPILSDLLDAPRRALQSFGLVRPPLSDATADVSIDLVQFEVYAEPQAFVVDDLQDAVDQSPGDGQCRTAGGLCTLRAAIQESNALSGRQRIQVPAGIHPLTLVGAGEDLAATGDLDILGDLEIAGSGAGVTIVDGGGIDRVFEINAAPVDSNVSITGLTIRNGSASTAAGATGGGVENGGALTLSDCEVVDNVANLAGGIMNRRQLLLDRCIVRDNEAIAFGFLNARAGGIASASSAAGGTNPVAEIRRSAIVRNRAPLMGGIELGDCASVLVENSTIAGNQDTQVSIADCDATFRHATVTNPTGIALTAGSASGSHVLELSNSAFEGLPACDLSSTAPVTLVELARNASNDSSCGLALPGDVEDVPLGLAPLAPWLGTEANVPQPGSPLIDAATGAPECLAEDQAGAARPQDGDGVGGAECDLGAIEVPEPRLALALAAGVLGVALRHRSKRGRPRFRSDGVRRTT